MLQADKNAERGLLSGGMGNFVNAVKHRLATLFYHSMRVETETIGVDWTEKLGTHLKKELSTDVAVVGEDEWNYGAGDESRKQGARGVAKKIEALVAENGYDTVLIVGKSVGGDVAHEAVKLLKKEGSNTAKLIKGILYIATPHSSREGHTDVQAVNIFPTSDAFLRGGILALHGTEGSGIRDGVPTIEIKKVGHSEVNHDTPLPRSRVTVHGSRMLKDQVRDIPSPEGLSSKAISPYDVYAQGLRYCLQKSFEKGN